MLVVVVVCVCAGVELGSAGGGWDGVLHAPPARRYMGATSGLFEQLGRGDPGRCKQGRAEVENHVGNNGE